MGMGQRIGLARRAMEPRCTQERMAELIGVSVQTVRDWEKGRARPEHRNLVRIAEVLGRPVPWFHEDEEAESVTLASLSAQIEELRKLLVEELGHRRRVTVRGRKRAENKPGSAGGEAQAS